MRGISRWRRRMLPTRREVILAARIEYSQTQEQQGMSIHDSRSSRSSNEKMGLPDLQREVERVIEDRLPADLEKLYGIKAEIRIHGCRYGSLSVFFGALLTGFGLIASYKDFYDSIHLLREHAELLLEELLGDRYSHHSFDVEVKIKHPRLPDPYDFYSPRRYWKMLGPELTESLWAFGAASPAAERPRRDAFFWFLLILCVVLMAALGVLAYAAIIKTYFP